MTSRFDIRMVTAESPPPRLLLYGDAGVGKTTFAGASVDPIIIVTEAGAQGLDVYRLPNTGVCKTWGELLECVGVLSNQEHDRKTVAIDTINQAVTLCEEFVCKRDFGGVWNASRGQEGFNSFGKGNFATAQELKKLLDRLDDLQTKGMMVMLCAHTGQHKVANALGSDYTAYGADVPKQSWAVLSAWADQIAHATSVVRTISREGEKVKAIAGGSERWMYFEPEPGRIVKSRAGYEMPSQVLFDYDTYSAALKTDVVGDLVERVVELYKQVGDADKKIVAERLGLPKKASFSAEAFSGLNKTKLDSLVNWLMSKREEA
jgi:hypothetical protein